MKAQLRRLTAMVLAVSMVASMIGIVPAMAATGSDGQIRKIGDSVSYYEQDGNYNSIYETPIINGKETPLPSPVPGVETVTVNDNDSSASVTVAKAIEGTSVKNEFDITLTVTTTDDISELEISPDAAVVLVFDTSISMGWNTYDSNDADTYEESRMYMAQEAAKTFVEGFAEEANDSIRMVSVVDFARYANTAQSWVDVASSTKLENVKDSIDDLTISTEGGTNIDAGLTVAETLVESLQKSNSEISSIYVVLLTDGAPTYYYENGSVVSASKAYGSTGTSIGTTVTASNTEAAADSIKDTGALLYTIAFAEGNNPAYFSDSTYSTSKVVMINDWLEDEIASAADMHYSAVDNEELSIGFETIVERIVQLASAWQVTDPMGQYIQLDANSISGSNNASVSEDGSTITWNLRNDVPKTSGSGDSKTYTYTLNYSFTLNTDAEGFEEDIYYLANGLTQLKYCFVADATDVTEEIAIDTVNFLVPAVYGNYPDYDYTVNHWVETDEDDKDTVELGGKFYKLVTAESDTKTVKKYEVVTETEMDYDEDSYYNSGDPSVTITIDTTGEEINFYYNRISTTAVVNHYYSTTTYSEQYPEGNTVETSDSVGYIGYVGEEYTANATSFETNGGFELVKSETVNGSRTTGKNAADSITIDLAKQDSDSAYNIINFYYEKTVEEREVEITVAHQYTNYIWELNRDGKWEEVADTANVFYGENDYSKQYYGTQYTVTLDDAYLNGTYEGFESLPSNIDQLGTYTLTDDSTAITLYYEKHIDNPNASVDVVVTHIYQVETITIDANGDKVITNPTTEYTDVITFTNYFEGEEFEANTAEYCVALQIEYDYQKDLSDSLVIKSLATEGNEITIYYLRTDDQRQETEITVYHDYTYITGFINEETGAYEYKTNDMEALDWNDTYNLDVDGTQLYAGQFYTAIPDSKGYNLETQLEDLAIKLVKNSGDNSITIQYLLLEDLDAATVTVNHYYKTYTETYIQGVISVNKGFYTLGHTDSYEGHVGESYTAETILSYDGNDDYTLVDSSDLTVVLSDDAKTIYIFYYRTEQDFVETEAVVNHHFITTTSYIDSNGDVKVDIDEDSVYGDYTNINEDGETLYAGMAFYAVEDANLEGREGFTPASSNVTSMFLNEDKDENVIDLYYYASDDQKGDAVTVTVYHHYDVYSNALEGTENIRTLDEEASSVVIDPAYGTYYAGQFYTNAQITLNGFDFVSADDDYDNKELVAGENEIHIYYEKDNNLPVETTLDVVHVYTTNYMSGESALVETDDTTPQITSYVGAVYPITLVTKDIFTVTGADADQEQAVELGRETCTIVLDEESNTITIYYERTEDDRIELNVIVKHNYAVHDLYTEVTTGEGTDEFVESVYLHQETYTAEFAYSYATLEGYVYTYSYEAVEDGEETIELSAEGGNVITLNYLRTIDTTPEEVPSGGNTSFNTYYSLTVSYVDQEGNEVAEGEYTSRIRSGTSYTTEEKAVEGYTFLEMHADSDTASGTIRSDKDVIYVYTADVVEVPEEDVPLIETPETSNTPETTETPETSDTPEVEPEVEVEVEPEVEVEIPVVEVPEVEVLEVEIPEVEVPLADIPVIEIPEVEVPLSDVPQTGDNRNLPFLMTIAGFSAIGLAVLAKLEMDDKKKRAGN